MAVDERDCGGLAMRKLDGKAQVEMRACEPELVLAHLVEETRAVAQHDRGAGDRIPDHVSEATQAGKRKADLIPVRVQRHVAGRADGQQPLG